MIQPVSAQDIFLWPCGTKCYRSEYEACHYQQMIGDFEIVAVGSPRYAMIDAEGGESLETTEAEARPYHLLHIGIVRDKQMGEYMEIGAIKP